jgi:hypothetical protein
MFRRRFVPLTGGCQCGAVRYAMLAQPDASVCHCRMCQKAVGGPFAAFATLGRDKFQWTRGAPAVFRSSSIAERGFCAACGTPLTYQGVEDDKIDVTICSLDHPQAVTPTRAVGIEGRLAWLRSLADLPAAETEDANAALVNYQHPDSEMDPGLPADISGIARPPEEANRKLRLLQELVFGSNRGNAASCLGAGWSPEEPDFNWTSGQQSEIALPHPGPGDVLLEIDAFAFIEKPALPVQHLFVSVNATPLGCLLFTDDRRQALRVPASLLAGRSAMRLEFRHPDAGRPSDYSANRDDRELALCFKRLRVFSLPDPVHLRLEGTGGIDVQDLAASGIAATDLLSGFESLGDNCEFGVVQRRAGCEPLGLMRFSEMQVAHLAPAIEHGFEGMGDPDGLDYSLIGEGRRMYRVHDRKSHLIFNTLQWEDEIEPTLLVPQHARRFKVLRDKFLEDMRDGSKIFVVRRNDAARPLSEHEIFPVFAALNQHGPCSLLFVTLADEAHPPGTVEMEVPGLLHGFLDMLPPYHDVHQLSFNVWLQVCMHAKALHAQMKQPNYIGA